MWARINLDGQRAELGFSNVDTCKNADKYTAGTADLSSTMEENVNLGYGLAQGVQED